MKPQKTRAYLRVSTDEQDLRKNRADILHLANEKNLGKVIWVEETISGRMSWKKRKIAQVIEEMGLGKNTAALLTTISNRPHSSTADWTARTISAGSARLACTK